MSNRTYRYFNGKPLFAFGHGLSYTKFDYSDRPQLDTPTNVTRERHDQSFVHFEKLRQARRRRSGAGLFPARPFRRAATEAGALRICARSIWRRRQRRDVTMDIPVERFRYWDTTQKQYAVEPGEYELLVGAASDDIRLRVPFEVSPSALAANR